MFTILPGLKSEVSSFTFDEILTFIKEHSPTYADAIISEFLDMEERKKCARIHNDFATALANMTPREIAVALEFGFFDSDLYALAKLHQNGQFREKIEDLLTDCNFHQECNAFMNGDYDSISRYT